MYFWFTDKIFYILFQNL